MKIKYKNVLPDIDENVLIADGAKVIGDVKIAAESSIWFNTVVRGDVNNIVIGQRTNIQDNCVIHVSSTGQGTYIGDNVTVGHMVILHACTIGNDSFIGMQSCIMDNVNINSGAMVAAGSLVTMGTEIPSGELWGGRPAKKMRDLRDEEVENIKHSAVHYAKLAKEYID